MAPPQPRAGRLIPRAAAASQSYCVGRHKLSTGPLGGDVGHPACACWPQDVSEVAPLVLAGPALGVRLKRDTEFGVSVVQGKRPIDSPACESNVEEALRSTVKNGCPPRRRPFPVRVPVQDLRGNPD